MPDYTTAQRITHSTVISIFLKINVSNYLLEMLVEGFELPSPYYSNFYDLPPTINDSLDSFSLKRMKCFKTHSWLGILKLTLNSSVDILTGFPSKQLI